MPEFTPLVGAYVPSPVMRDWSHREAAHNFAALQAFGVTAIFTEAEDYRDDLIALAHKTGLRFVGGIACFLDLIGDGKLLDVRPELWPVMEDGERRPKMEWYTGVTPTHDDFNIARLHVLSAILAKHDLDGVVLDFVRWPLHWEQEIRPGMAPPPQCSFDAHTVRRFVDSAGLVLPSEANAPAVQARWILDHHRAAWVDFKCRVITDFVAQARQCVDQASERRPVWLGAYIVPGTPTERESLVGQRVRDLAPLVDVLLPMTYQPMLYRPPDWVAERTTEIAEDAGHTPVVPVLQVDSTGNPPNEDWGPPLPIDDWRDVVAGALAVSPAGLVTFTGPMLFNDEGARGAVLREEVTRFNLEGLT